MQPIAALLLLTAALSGVASADVLVSRGALGVDRYTNNGVFLANWIPPGAGGLSNARGVAVAPTGELFVGDFLNDNILLFAANGTFLGVFASGGDVHPFSDVVFGTDGDLFVSSGPQSIARLDRTTGAVITSNFTSGNVTPIGTAQYLEFGPALALTDQAGHLFRFDPVTGAHISTSILDNPVGVAYAANGDLYVAQRISDNVLRFPFGGGPAEVAVPNGAFGGSPTDIEFGPNGLLYISADAIYRFDVSGAQGVFVDSFGDGGAFLAFGPDIPEPHTWLLVGGGLVFAAFLRRCGFRGM